MGKSIEAWVRAETIMEIIMRMLICLATLSSSLLVGVTLNKRQKTVRYFTPTTQITVVPRIDSTAGLQTPPPLVIAVTNEKGVTVDKSPRRETSQRSQNSPRFVWTPRSVGGATDSPVLAGQTSPSVVSTPRSPVVVTIRLPEGFDPNLVAKYTAKEDQAKVEAQAREIAQKRAAAAACCCTIL